MSLESGVSQAEAATRLLYDTDLTDLCPEEAEAALQYDPRYYTSDEKDLIDVPLSKLAAKSGLTRSRGKYQPSFASYIFTEIIPGEAVRLIEAGGLYLNNVAVSCKDCKLEHSDLLGNRVAILRAGKDKYMVLAVKL